MRPDDKPRMVPMTREQRNRFTAYAIDGHTPNELSELLGAAITAFDAAPDADRVRQNVFDILLIKFDYDMRVEGAVDAVLRALGYPDPDASEPRASQYPEEGTLRD